MRSILKAMNPRTIMPEVHKLCTEHNFGAHTNTFQDFSQSITRALDSNNGDYSTTLSTEEMHPMMIHALDTIISSARENIRILTTNLPTHTKYGLDLWSHERVKKPLISAGRRGIDIDVILRNPEDFTHEHELHLMDIASNVHFYNAVDRELKNSKNTHVIVDDRASIFTHQTDGGEKAEIIVGNAMKEVEKLTQTFNELIGDSRFTGSRNTITSAAA